MYFEPLTKDILCCHHSFPLKKMDYHRHDGFEVYIFLNGGVNYHIEQQCYHLERGNILTIRPNEYHCAETLDSNIYERIYINFKLPYFNSLSSQETDLTSCFLNKFSGKDNLRTVNEQELLEFIMLFQQLSNANNSQSYGHDLLARSYSLQFLVKLNRLFQASPDERKPTITPPLVKDAMLYINDHLTEDISLNDLSQHLYHNGTYISRRFKASTGLTVQQYILVQRIDLAKQYLQNGMSVTDTCWMSGFNNYSNFSRTFTSLVGTSPKKYQNLFRL